MAEHELVCPDCGNLRSICSDPNRDWFPFRSYCYASGVRDMHLRRVEKRHGSQSKHPPGDPLHVTDGLRVGVMLDDPDPDETFFDSSSGPEALAP